MQPAAPAVTRLQTRYERFDRAQSEFIDFVTQQLRENPSCIIRLRAPRRTGATHISVRLANDLQCAVLHVTNSKRTFRLLRATVFNQRFFPLNHHAALPIPVAFESDKRMYVTNSDKPWMMEFTYNFATGVLREVFNPHDTGHSESTRAVITDSVWPPTNASIWEDERPLIICESGSWMPEIALKEVGRFISSPVCQTYFEHSGARGPSLFYEAVAYEKRAENDE